MTQRPPHPQEVDIGQQRFRALFETTLNAVVLTDATQRFIDVNPAASELVGYTRTELLAMRLDDFVVAAPGQIDARLGALNLMRHERGLVRLRRKDGVTVVVEFSAVADMLPGVTLYVLQDVSQRHAMERELRERIARYDLVVEGVRDGIWDWDIQRKRVFLSPQWKRLRGYEDHEYGSNYSDWSAGVHPDDAERVHKALQAHVKGDAAIFDQEYRVRCKDGSWKWVRDRGIAQRDTNGRALRMAGAETDITPRKSAEAVLRRREQELLETQRLGNIGSWLWDVETSELEWSEQRYRIFGLNPAMGLSPKTADQEIYYTPESWPKVLAARRALIDHGTPYQLEAQIIRPSGERRSIIAHGEVERDANGRITKYRGTAQDVTEQRRAELDRLEAIRRLHDISSQFDLVVSVAGLGMARHDLRTGITLFDDNMRAMLGLPPNPLGLSQKEGLDLVHPDDRARFLAGRDECLRTGHSDLSEQRVRHVDGSWRRLVGRRVLVRGAAGQPESMTLLVLDVTEQRQAESALRGKEQAEQANRAKTEFLSRMSHELRTPLNAVLGFSELLLHDSKQPLAAHQQAQVQHVHGAGKHLLRLIEDLLDISRIEIEALQVHHSQVDAHAVFSQTLTDLSQLAKTAHVSLRLVCPVDSAVLTTDITRLRQVAYNLVSNAIKYNKPGGRVDVTLGVSQDKLCVSVADDGLGMDAQQLAKLFQPFDRLGRENTSIAGVGIGLAISRDIVQRLGGELSVRSAVGEGTVFSFALPLTVKE